MIGSHSKKVQIARLCFSVNQNSLLSLFVSLLLKLHRLSNQGRDCGTQKRVRKLTYFGYLSIITRLFLSVFWVTLFCRPKIALMHFRIRVHQAMSKTRLENIPFWWIWNLFLKKGRRKLTRGVHFSK